MYSTKQQCTTTHIPDLPSLMVRKKTLELYTLIHVLSVLGIKLFVPWLLYYMQVDEESTGHPCLVAMAGGGVWEVELIKQLKSRITENNITW